MRLLSFSYPAIALSCLAAFSKAACLQDSSASRLATAFLDLTSDYNTTLADQIISPTFIDNSESINSLMNMGCDSAKPLLGPSFTSRQDFQDQASQQPPTPYQVTQYWFTCDTIFIRWVSNQSPQPVVGITVGTVVEAPVSEYEWVFEKVWVEFDSAAWMVNIGVLTPTCSASKRKDMEVDVAWCKKHPKSRFCLS